MIPDSGKLIFAANPWLLAAAAKREGYATDRFRESDLVPDGKVVVVDLDALKLPDDPNARAWLGVEPQFTEEETP